MKRLSKFLNYTRKLDRHLYMGYSYQKFKLTSMWEFPSEGHQKARNTGAHPSTQHPTYF